MDCVVLRPHTEAAIASVEAGVMECPLGGEYQPLVAFEISGLSGAIRRSPRSLVQIGGIGVFVPVTGRWGQLAQLLL